MRRGYERAKARILVEESLIQRLAIPELSSSDGLVSV